MTWMGGHVEDAAVATRDTQAAETALMDAVKSMSFWQKDMKPNEAKVSFRAKRLDLPTEGVEPMARMEPNIPALLSDSDEGSELWRHRIRGNKKRFCRTQLLATVSLCHPCLAQQSSTRTSMMPCWQADFESILSGCMLESA